MVVEAGKPNSSVARASLLSSSPFWGPLGEALRRLGFVRPECYLVLDIETDGVEPANNNILQVGYVLVLDGTPSQSGRVFIETPESVLQVYENSDYVRRKKAAGNTGYVKAEDVRAYGVPRPLAFVALASMLDAVFEIPGAWVVGHNITGFDVPFIEYFTAKCGKGVKFDRTRLFDTGAVVKAIKIRKHPVEGETLWNFFGRVREYIAKGVYWRLEVTVQELGLSDVVDARGAHDAEADCLMTQAVFDTICAKLAETS